MRSLNRYAQKPLPWSRVWKSIHGNADAIKTPLLLLQKNRMQNHPITAEAVDVGMRMRMSIMNTGIHMIKTADADIPTDMKPGTMNNTNTNTNITMWKPADADTRMNMRISMNITNTSIHMIKTADADIPMNRKPGTMSITNTNRIMANLADADTRMNMRISMNISNTTMANLADADADTSTNMSINMNIMNTTMAKPADADMNIRRRLPLQNPPHDPKLLFPPLQSEKFIP